MKDALIVMLFTKYKDNQIKKDEMDLTCSTAGINEMCVQNLAGKYEGTALLGKYIHRWKIILIWMLRK
jgi:hypothetical protein